MAILPVQSRAVLTTVGSLWGDGRGPVLIFVASGWFLSIGSRLVFPAILPALRTTFGLDLSTAGFLLTLMWATYALGQLPGGLLADRVGERNVLVVSTLGTGGALGLVVFAANQPMMLASVAVFGFVTAIYGTTRITVLSNIYPDRGGTAIGLTSAAGNVGNSILPFVAGLLTATISWRFSLGMLIPAFFLVAGGLWWNVPKQTSNPTITANFSVDTARRIGKVIRKPTITPVALVIILAFFIWQGFTGFYPTYLVDVKGLESSTAAGLFGLFFALGIVVEPVSGMARDRFGTRPTLTVAFVVQTTGLVILQLIEGFVPLLIITVILASILAPTTIMFAHLSDALPMDIQGTALGFIRTMYMLVGASSPWVIGSLADQGLFVEAFWLLAVIAAVIAVLCTFVVEV